MRAFAVVAIVGMLALAGCETLDAQAAQEAREAAEAAAARIEAHQAALADLLAKHAAGELGTADVLAEVKRIEAEWEQDAAALAALRAAAESGLPWWYLALAGASTAVGVAGTYYVKAKPLAALLQAVVIGIEKANSQTAKDAVQAVAEAQGVEAKLHTIVKRLTG